METVRIPGLGGLGLAGDLWGSPTSQPVLLQHGGGQSRHAWKRTADGLAQAGYRVLNVDARGHGDSEWCPDQLYDMEHMAADVLALVDHLGRPPVVVGASMGGMSALTAQGHDPTRQLFAGVVLVDITPRIEIAGARRVMEFMAANPEGFATLDEAADAIAAYNPNRARSGSAEGLLKVLRQGEDGRWFWRWDPAWLTSKAELHRNDPALLEERMAQFAQTMHDAAASLTVPTLLVRGQQSDLVTPEAVREFQQAAPHAEFVDVSGAGHMVAGDENDVFTAAVSEFLLRTVPPAA